MKAYYLSDFVNSSNGNHSNEKQILFDDYGIDVAFNFDENRKSYHLIIYTLNHFSTPKGNGKSSIKAKYIN